MSPDESIATDRGKFRLADVPVASIQPASPDPTNVVTTPEKDTFRIKLSLPAAYTLSKESIAMPFGLKNVAMVPWPLLDPRMPLPARVDVKPVGVTMRIRFPECSLTARFPPEKMAMAIGQEKVAIFPAPSLDEKSPVPASVVTAREVDINRMRLFKQSATAMLPLARTATPKGSAKRADDPVPSRKPCTPPAIVEEAPRGVTRRIR